MVIVIHTGIVVGDIIACSGRKLAEELFSAEHIQQIASTEGKVVIPMKIPHGSHDDGNSHVCVLVVVQETVGSEVRMILLQSLRHRANHS